MRVVILHTCTYVNEGIVEELGVKGEKELITVIFANDQQVSFPSMTFTIGLESVDVIVDAKIVAQTSEKICGGMKVVDWVKIKGKWNQLQDIPFLWIPMKLENDHYVVAGRPTKSSKQQAVS